MRIKRVFTESLDIADPISFAADVPSNLLERCREIYAGKCHRGECLILSVDKILKWSELHVGFEYDPSMGQINYKMECTVMIYPPGEMLLAKCFQIDQTARIAALAIPHGACVTTLPEFMSSLRVGQHIVVSVVKAIYNTGTDVVSASVTVYNPGTVDNRIFVFDPKLVDRAEIEPFIREIADIKADDNCKKILTTLDNSTTVGTPIERILDTAGDAPVAVTRSGVGKMSATATVLGADTNTPNTPNTVKMIPVGELNEHTAIVLALCNDIISWANVVKSFVGVLATSEDIIAHRNVLAVYKKLVKPTI